MDVTGTGRTEHRHGFTMARHDDGPARFGLCHRRGELSLEGLERETFHTPECTRIGTVKGPEYWTWIALQASDQVGVASVWHLGASRREEGLWITPPVTSLHHV
jgi:hypothetical protein